MVVPFWGSYIESYKPTRYSQKGTTMEPLCKSKAQGLAIKAPVGPDRTQGHSLAFGLGSMF